MKQNIERILSSVFFLSAVFILTSCGGSDDNNDSPTPPITISIRSCSISDGTEYIASDLKEVTISYNNVVAVSSSAGITLNGTQCTAKSSSTTAMDVIITLPTLEEGKSYTLKVAEGAIVSKNDASVSAPAYSITFTTKAAVQPIGNDATALTKKLAWGWNLGNHFDTSSGEDGKPNQWSKGQPSDSYPRLHRYARC